MSDLIKRLVEIDKACVKLVEDAKLQKSENELNVATMQQELYNQSLAHKKDTLDAYSKELENNFQQQLEILEKESQNQLELLEKNFNQKKADYLQKIIVNSLKI